MLAVSQGFRRVLAVRSQIMGVVKSSETDKGVVDSC